MLWTHVGLAGTGVQGHSGQRDRQEPCENTEVGKGLAGPSAQQLDGRYMEGGRRRV